MVRLAVRVRRAEAELVLAELLDLVPGGVEEVDLGKDGVEYAAYGPPGELPSLPDMQAAVGDALVGVSSTEIPNDWEDRWRQFHKSLVLDGRLTVRPPWEPPASTEIDIVIDPGRAFGTGSHPTTRLCLELMLSLAGRGSFLDLGCGSGLLAIAAARLGFDPVVAIDNDPASVDAARSNATANGVPLEVRRLDLRTDPVEPGFRIVAANLLPSLLQQWAKRMDHAPRRVIASGLLEQEADEVAATFGRSGLVRTSQLSDGGWATLLLERVDKPAT